VLPFENVEGIILLRGTLRGHAGADTSGPLVLDTGAGYLAIDQLLARSLGLLDSASATEPIDVTDSPLPRLTIGDWSMDQVQPVLTVDASIVRRVSGRPVLGLIGHRPLADRTSWIDYEHHVVALIPATRPRADPARGERESPGAALERSRTALGALLSRNAVPVRFRLLGDGKILISGAVSDPGPPSFSRPLSLLIDTGATKCVLFEDALEGMVRRADRWPAIRGLVAPTLVGAASARIARVPSIRLGAMSGRLVVRDVDVGVIRSELSRALARVTAEVVHGVVGYSLLKRFRVGVDYANQIMWLDPIPDYQDDRPFEYCHVGLQFERRDGAVMVTGVVEGSPAAGAGIRPGDELLELDGVSCRGVDLADLTRRMEGEPGKPVTLVIRRGDEERTVRLVRRRLL